MSFLSYELHEQQRHAEYFVCNFRNGPSLCLACFLHSLADPSHLDSRKLFALREFVGLFTCGSSEGGQLLHGLLTQHASILVNGFLSAVASTQDLGLAQALHQAAAHMCSCAAEFLPELFTERLLQLLLELTWPDSTPGPTAVPATAAVASGLQLLQELIVTHSSAAVLLSQVLQSSRELVALMTQGLACGVEAIVLPLLHIFSCLAHSSGIAAVPAVPMGCLIPATLAKDLFISLLQLLPDLLAPDLRMLVVQVLLRLAETGYAVEQAATAHQLTAPAPILGSSSQLSQQHQQHDNNPQQHMLAATIMAGLKPLLLDTNLQLQLLGMQLLASVTTRASGLLLHQLIDADMCEHVYEVLRGTLSCCSMRAKLAAATIADEQRRRGRISAAADGADAAAAAAEFEVLCEGLQYCAVRALRCLASQGVSFLEHFHFGIETLTDLLQHTTTTANSPLLAELLTLLADITAPHNPSSLLLPAAALAKLAAAAAAVLPEPTLHDHTADSAAAPTAVVAMRFDSASDSSRQQGMSLQPSPDLQTAYEAACTLLTHFCLKWGGNSSSTTWTVLQPHILAGVHKALGALSILTTRSLAGGYLAAACKLVAVSGQLLINVVVATSSSKELEALQEAGQTAATAAAGQFCSNQNKPSKSNSKRKGSAAGTADYKPFAKRRQQQQQPLAGSAAAAYRSREDNADVLHQQSAVDDVLMLMESVLLHLVSAASTVLTAASTEFAAAAGSQQQQQQEGALVAQLMQAVHGVLLMLLSAGTSSVELCCFLPSFCGQLLCTNKWCSLVWSIIEAQTLPAAAAVDAWTVLLLAAAHLEGPAFLTGVSNTFLASLAAALSAKASSSVHLLELLCSSSSQEQPAAAPSQQQYGRNSSRQAAALAAAANTADIRQFCGVSDLSKGALCIVAAAVRSGDICWSWQDVLITLDAVVAHAGPGVLSQSDLLYNIVLLYIQVEQQLAADLVSQQCSMICSDGVLLSDQQQQQQYMTYAGASGDPQTTAAAAAVAGRGLSPIDLAVQHLPTPSAILHAIQKAATTLPTSQPEDDIAQWVLARAMQLPAAAQQLLQRWMLLLLPAPPAAAAAGDSGSCNGTSQSLEAQLQLQQQQQVSASLMSVLGMYPTALVEVLHTAKQCQESKQQQQQLAAWLTVITGAVQSSSSHSSSGNYLAAVSRHVYAARYNTDGGAQTAGSSSSTSWTLLPELLLGPSGTLELLRRSLLGHLSAAASSIGASCVIISCNNALLAVMLWASDGGGVLSDQGVMRQLMQQGIGQVHLAATRLLQISSNHPLQQQLLLSTANAANALLHMGLLLQLDAALLQQLSACQELVQLIELIAAAAVGRVKGYPGGVDELQPHQQQEQQQLLQCSREEAELIQMLQVVLVESGLGSSSSSLSMNSDGAAAAATRSNGSMQLISVSRESLLLAALQWQQLLDLMSQLTQQQSPAAAAQGADHGVMCSLTGPHLLLMAQNAKGSVVSLLLLDSVRLLLQKQAAAAAAVLEADLSASQQQCNVMKALPQMQAMLQNIVVAAASDRSSSSPTYQSASVSCLAACYETAAAAITYSRTSSSSSVAHGMAESRWNLSVIKVVLERFCRTATYLQAKVLEMDQAAAVTAAGVENAGAAPAAAAAAAKCWLSWVYASDCQQQVHLWCADAQLLLDCIKMLLAVMQYEKMQDASTANSRSKHSSSSTGSSGEKLLIKLQQLVLPYLEQQQQMVSLICWAAARLAVVQAAATAASSRELGHHLMQQQQRYSDGHQPSQHAVILQQQQRQPGDPGQPGAAQRTAGQYCLQLCLCNTALQLLAGLLDSGCFGGQLPWLHQQLQQQLWAVSQQQQGSSSCSTVLSSTGQQMSGLMSVGALEVVDGAAVGLLRPCVVRSLLQAAGHQQHTLDCQMVLDAVAAGMQQLRQGTSA